MAGNNIFLGKKTLQIKGLLEIQKKEVKKCFLDKVFNFKDISNKYLI